MIFQTVIVITVTVFFVYKNTCQNTKKALEIGVSGALFVFAFAG